MELGCYRIHKTIGEGNFAEVKLATHNVTGQLVAIKVIEKTLLNDAGREKLDREIQIMKEVDHPNIIKLYQVIERPETTYLVMEYAEGGEVFQHLVKNGRMKEEHARIKFRQIVSAVFYLHSKHIVHRDLKAENLLLDKYGNIKIADFGFSNKFAPNHTLDTFCGSPPYAAPELFEGKHYEGPEVDIWSLGVVLYTLVAGCLPFDGATMKELRKAILAGRYRVPFDMSNECEGLLKKLLARNPTKRFPLHKIMDDKWINLNSHKLRPYIRTVGPDTIKEKHLQALEARGFNRSIVVDSVRREKFDIYHALYLLLENGGTVLNTRRTTTGARQMAEQRVPAGYSLPRNYCPQNPPQITTKNSPQVPTRNPLQVPSRNPSHAPPRNRVFPTIAGKPPPNNQHHEDSANRSIIEAPSKSRGFFNRSSRYDNDFNSEDQTVRNEREFNRNSSIRKTFHGASSKNHVKIVPPSIRPADSPQYKPQSNSFFSKIANKLKR